MVIYLQFYNGQLMTSITTIFFLPFLLLCLLTFPNRPVPFSPHHLLLPFFLCELSYSNVKSNNKVRFGLAIQNYDTAVVLPGAHRRHEVVPRRVAGSLP